MISLFLLIFGKTLESVTTQKFGCFYFPPFSLFYVIFEIICIALSTVGQPTEAQYVISISGINTRSRPALSVICIMYLKDNVASNSIIFPISCIKNVVNPIYLQMRLIQYWDLPPLPPSPSLHSLVTNCKDNRHDVITYLNLYPHLCLSDQFILL